MTIPRYVVGTAAEATRILHRLSRTGWHPRAGFGLPPAGSPMAMHLVLYGRVTTLSVAAAAAASAARGVGLVAIADAASPSGRALLAALEGSGPVFRSEHAGDVSADALMRPASNNHHHHNHTAGETAGAEGQVLTNLLPEQRALLGRLANGETIATAAAAEYLSLRTANRRIAQARSQLGVRTTREAVIVFLRQRRPE
jgi:hypothetical protein